MPVKDSETSEYPFEHPRHLLKIFCNKEDPEVAQETSKLLQRLSSKIEISNSGVAWSLI